MGRPSSFTQEIADAICRRLAGGESLRKICADDGLPDARTVYRWIEENEPFRQQYARAREIQADVLAEEVVDIADEHPATVIKPRGGGDEGGGETIVIDSAAVAHQRLRVDARKWFASKLAPKKYGDKLEHSGSVEGFSLIVNPRQA